jgi:hypothetical protein
VVEVKKDITHPDAVNVGADQDRDHIFATCALTV